MRAPEQVETARLRMRLLAESDFEAFARLYADETSRFIGGPCKPEDAWRRMASYVGHWTLRGFGFWALESKANGAFLGYCGLWLPHGRPEHEVGWGLLPETRGLGYATEAAIAARLVAYRNLGWPTLVSYIVPENIASCRVAERLGARLEAGTITLQGGVEAGIYRHPSPKIVLGACPS